MADDPRVPGSEEDQKSMTWMRPHQNGMDAIVYEVASNDGNDRYAAGALPRAGGVSSFSLVRSSLERAQADADQAAGCRPCTCPPWAK